MDEVERHASPAPHSTGYANVPETSAGMFQYIREDLRSFRAEMTEQFRNLVTLAAFQAETRRVDDRFRDIKDDLDSERLSRIEGQKNLETKLVESLSRTESKFTESLMRVEAKFNEENERKRKQDEKNSAFIKWAIAIAAGLPTALGVWFNFLQHGLGG